MNNISKKIAVAGGAGFLRSQNCSPKTSLEEGLKKTINYFEKF